MNTDKPTRRPRRCKILYVTEQEIIASITAPGNQYRIVCEYNLPPDCQVIGVWPDFTRSAFGVVLEHPSFADVPDGEQLPEIEAQKRVEQVTRC